MKIILIALATIVMTAFAAADDSKPLVVYRIDNCPVEMRQSDEYGVMLINDGGLENPSPRYIVAIAKTRTVVDTKDLELFSGIIKRIPKGSTIFQYDSCTSSRSFGLTEAQSKAYNKVFSGSGLTLSEEARITCYCVKMR